MNRRNFIKSLVYGSTALVSGAFTVPDVWAEESNNDRHIKDYLNKLKNYDAHFPEDIVVKSGERSILRSCARRLKRVQSIVGYANFSLLSFDEALQVARNYSAVGEFPKREIDFLESVFYTNSAAYGFYGEKVLTNLTVRFPRRDTVKIPHTGHYLFKGAPVALYNQIKKQVGTSVTLTSGVRGIVKQMHLFLAKADHFDGNLSLASRSLAPPGHSFHGVGDFDVGKAGLGYRNFTEYFSTTDEYKKLTDLGYIKIRYPEGNPFGVRFEPWHIKVIG